MSLRASLTRVVIRLGNRLIAAHRGVRWKNRLCELLPSFPPPPPGTRVTRFRIGTMAARRIEPRGTKDGDVILYLHGGGWIYGWMFVYDGLVARIAAACRANALGISYRLAPDHPFPAALDDCLAAYRHLLDAGTSPGRIVLMGDSAGANLVLVLMLACRERGWPLPGAAVCLSPPTDLSAPGETYRTNRGSDALLSPSFARLVLEAYAADRDCTDPLISPVFGSVDALRCLPPLLIQAGGGELLLSDAVRFAERTRSAGGAVKLTVYPGMWHVFQLTNPWLPESKRAIREIGDFVSGLRGSTDEGSPDRDENA